jgi:hypothetical protein
LTMDEWQAGMHFLDEVGHMYFTSEKTRHEMHRISDVIGLESYVLLTPLLCTVEYLCRSFKTSFGVALLTTISASSTKSPTNTPRNPAMSPPAAPSSAPSGRRTPLGARTGTASSSRRTRARSHSCTAKSSIWRLVVAFQTPSSISGRPAPTANTISKIRTIRCRTTCAASSRRTRTGIIIFIV